MGSPPITLRPFFYYYFWNDAFIWRVRPCKALATILGMPGRPVGDPSLGWERRLLIVNANKLEWGVEIELSRIPAPFLFTAGTWGM